MKELYKFYNNLLLEVAARQQASEDGDTQEQAFTRRVLEYLADSGDTENVDVAYDERDLGTKKQHKINGYAIADNYETVDLFISIYTNDESIPSIPKSEIDRAFTRLSNFFRKAIYNDYVNDIAESSEIFQFAHTLADYDELRNNLVRVNAFVLTNGSYKGDVPENKDICGYKFFNRVVDVNYLYQLSDAARVPIEIDFDEEGYHIPCLSSNTVNEEYQAYIAILPGQCLASLYERYGSRLLEQNVRSFLQFTGKINKGIRETIKKEPCRFLAYNNGLAVTADSIVLNDDGHSIKKITNLQIVNGGQTTASLYYTNKKDGADLSEVLVQAKISVIHNKDDYDKIVGDISRCANTQNKVSNVDLTANNPTLVAIEKVSRYTLSPVSPNKSLPTYWFFERTKKQYATLKQREGFTKARKKAFELRYPLNQVITKSDLGKFINAYEEVYDGKRLAIGPHIVVKGAEKNYAQFMNYNLPSNPNKIDNVFFEDTVAKAIIFQTASRRYGVKGQSFCLGDLRSAVVPYTICLLNIITEGHLNLYRIWKNQSLSDALSDFVYDLMKQVNDYIIEVCPVSNYTEWVKKLECWEMVKANKWAYNIEEIVDDLIDPKKPPMRRKISEEDNKLFEHNVDIIKSIPSVIWKNIADWGAESGMLNINLQSKAHEIASLLKYNHELKAVDVARGITIFNIVCEKNYELLQDADKLLEEENVQKEARKKELSTIKSVNVDDVTIDIDLIKEMVLFDKKQRILEDWKYKVMYDISIGLKPLTEKLKWGMKQNLKLLLKKGFVLPQ